MTDMLQATHRRQATVVKRRHEPAVSVVVPIAERAEELTDLYREYAKPLRESGRSFEFVFVAEPWGEGLTDALAVLAAEGEPIRVFKAGHTLGEAGLLKIAAAETRAPLVMTLPPYRRVEASVLPQLIERVEQGADLAVARRWPRHDSWINRLQNRAFHLLLGRLAGGKLHDVACGVRVFRRKVLERLPLYGDFSRFLPLLALREGYRVDEVRAAQHPADTPARVYSPGIYLRRLIDVLGVFFLSRFTEKPLRFFGLLGSSMMATGTAVLLMIVGQRIFADQGLADRPMLLLGVLLVVVGVQAIALGLVGEIIVHLSAARRAPYRLLDITKDD